MPMPNSNTGPSSRVGDEAAPGMVAVVSAIPSYATNYSENNCILPIETTRSATAEACL